MILYNDNFLGCDSWPCIYGGECPFYKEMQIEVFTKDDMS